MTMERWNSSVNVDVMDISRDLFGKPWDLVKWELTYACNLKCIHCLVNAGEPDPSEINQKKLLKKIASKVSAIEPSMVLLSGGEPLLSRHLPLILNELKSHQTFVNIETNGLLINDRMLRLLSRLECDFVCVNLQGINMTHDKIVGVNGAWAKAQESIVSLVKNSINVGILLVVTSLNFSEIGNVIEWAVSRGIQKIFINEGLPLGRGYLNRAIFPHKSSLKRLRNNLNEQYKDLIKKGRLIINFDRLEELKKDSIPGKRKFVIKPDGKVRVSDCIPLLIGDFLADKPSSLYAKINKTLLDHRVRNFIKELKDLKDLTDIKFAGNFLVDRRIVLSKGG